MSETLAAFLILPVLIGLVAVLECTRAGCTWLSKRLRRPALTQDFAAATRVSAAQDY